MRLCPHRNQSGFTLVELIIVLVVVGIISAYVFAKNSAPASYTLLSQAQTMASDIRHVQSLASTWGKKLRINVDTGTATYSVSCATTTGVVAPCNVRPVINPTTNLPFSVTLQKGVVLSGPNQLDVNSLGRPSAAATYGVNVGGPNVEVRVADITGFVTVVP